MKTVSKSAGTDSPKTPGGISKALLTPCRRVGLSRNWKKSGVSPFQSPLSSTSESNQEKLELRKRKKTSEEIEGTPENIKYDAEVEQLTPSKNVELPRKKKSKILLHTLNKTDDDSKSLSPAMSTCQDVNKTEVKATSANLSSNILDTSTPACLLSRSRSRKKIITSDSVKKSIDVEKENIAKQSPDVKPIYVENVIIDNTGNAKEKSPNNLTKECIVLIQKKIFNSDIQDNQTGDPKANKIKFNESNSTLQNILSDSDSEDVPLCEIKKPHEKKPALTNKQVEDFHDKNKVKLKKDNSSNSKKQKPVKPTPNVITVDLLKNDSQSSSDEDDDFYEKKRTILIRKSYGKVAKPQKAKSTGSITQKDVDELKARIETKKKMLMARAMTEDTKELKELIKKWQKGCQDALMELMDLMKSKCPDKRNMNYSEILETLKIPASLIGYDSDNDSFLTPNDESVILGNIKV